MYRFWIISLLESRVIFTRFWPHSERRDGFIFPRVSQDEFLRILFSSLGITNQSNNKSSNPSLMKDRSLTNASDADYISMRSGISSIGTIGTLTSKGSSGSNDSLNSLMSSNTIASSASAFRKEKRETSSEFDDFDFISVPNFLPIITCRFVTKPHENQEHRSLYIDLNLVVYESKGYLFICCPRFLTKNQQNYKNRTILFEELFLEEQNMSLSFSALQAISTEFFDSGKNLKLLEFFITENMPFGTLINDLRSSKTDIRQQISKSPDSKRPQYLIHIIIDEFLSSTLLNESETIFGTLDIVPNSVIFEPFPGTADLKITIDNLERFTLARPFNCDITSTGLVFNLKKSKIPPLGLLHYRTESLPEFSSINSISAIDNQSPVLDRKLFNYRYTITKKTNSNNLHHLQLIIALNSKIICDDLKFKYLMIKFSLLKQKSKVQTATSSFVNILVRESIKLSGGQIRNETNSCTWTLTKITKNGKYFVDFDILIPEDCFEYLDTSINFRLENRFQTQFKDNSRETNLRFQTKRIQSEICLSNTILNAGTGLKCQLPILLDYRLNSFEYKLFPKLI